MSGQAADPYVYEGTSVLRNIPDIREAIALATHEREATAQRMREDVPRGAFDAEHIKAIHRHIFQDVYAWAGQFRTIPISKGGNGFAEPDEIEGKLAALHEGLAERSYLRGLPAGEFSRMASVGTAMLNNVHPFREGNGRTQLAWLMQLGEAAGHPLNPMAIPNAPWIQASREAFAGNLVRMNGLIQGMMASPARERSAPQARRAVRDYREI